tara:strand:+ start:132 stop:491 length:360 start_codon:yes stop_codon:yes gene_type:complete
MKLWLSLFLLLSPSVARANTVTPQFTQGSMNATTNTTQTVNETIQTKIYGGEYKSWSGTNVTPSGAIRAADTTFTLHTAGSNFLLETVDRAENALVEQIDITRTINTTSTTTSLSTFSQ